MALFMQFVSLVLSRTLQRAYDAGSVNVWLQLNCREDMAFSQFPASRSQLLYWVCSAAACVPQVASRALPTCT